MQRFHPNRKKNILCKIFCCCCFSFCLEPSKKNPEFSASYLLHYRKHYKQHQCKKAATKKELRENLNIKVHQMFDYFFIQQNFITMCLNFSLCNFFSSSIPSLGSSFRAKWKLKLFLRYFAFAAYCGKMLIKLSVFIKKNFHSPVKVNGILRFFSCSILFVKYDELHGVTRQ